MKRISQIMILFMFSLIFMTQDYIYANSWDYLPGGDNYLNAEAFEFDGSFLSTQGAMLIKPNQDYIYTIENPFLTLFTEDEEVAELEFYEDNQLLLKVVIRESDFGPNGSEDAASYLFRSPMNANRMTMSIVDKDMYVSTYFFEHMILEEGYVFNGFEDYIDGTIMDTDSPQFSTVGTIYSYVHSPILIEEIQSSLSAYDVIDGDVTDGIEIIEDNYSENMTIIGDYTIVFTVSDQSGNSNQTVVNVCVIDVLKPVFSEVGKIIIAFPNTYTVSDIMSFLSASDNYDGDISSQIELVEDNYSQYQNIVGNYSLTFSVADSSGNETTYIQNIEVVDDEAPIISGIGEIVIGYDETITMEELLSHFTVTDNYDSPDSLELLVSSNQYSENKYILGHYVVKLSVSDSCGNLTEKDVIIEVVDEIGPIVYFDSSIIHTYTDQVLSMDDVANLLVKAKEIEAGKQINLSVIYDSYTAHATIPGTYHMKIRITSDDDYQLEKDFQIVVKEVPTITITVPEEESFLLRYKDYIIYGGMGLVLVLSNLIWFFINRRR